jgi:Uma2 family endonuclease
LELGVGHAVRPGDTVTRVGFARESFAEVRQEEPTTPLRLARSRDSAGRLPVYTAAVAEAAPRLTYAEYLALEASSEQRYEFVDGVVYAMAGGTPEHARLAMKLGATLVAALDRKGCSVYGSDLKLRVDATKRSTYADVVVVCGPERRSDVDPNAVTNPTVIVEVLSPSTEASDRGEKWRHYQHLDSLREYVLVSQDEPYVEVFRRDGDEWVLRTAQAGQMIELPSQAVQIAVDDIYARPGGQ